ncbi:hypothetical protein ACP70R_019356 [Stipagrostis hirtigluma subsp. patula]
MAENKTSEDYECIVPVADNRQVWNMNLRNYQHVRDKIKLFDPPIVPEVDENALKALGLNEFVHLNLCPASNQAKEHIAQFVAF